MNSEKKKEKRILQFKGAQMSDCTLFRNVASLADFKNKCEQIWQPCPEIPKNASKKFN